LTFTDVTTEGYDVNVLVSGLAMLSHSGRVNCCWLPIDQIIINNKHNMTYVVIPRWLASFRGIDQKAAAYTHKVVPDNG
jgi:hypothetical protein